jgi:hypothetical protein
MAKAINGIKNLRDIKPSVLRLEATLRFSIIIIFQVFAQGGRQHPMADQAPPVRHRAN